MRKKLSLILCIAMIISLMPLTSAFAAKTVKAKSVSVSPKSMTLAVGDIAQIKAAKKPTNSTDKLTWFSSDKSVATVTSKGVVQGISEGTATITVKTSSKKEAKCTVVVKNYIDENALREKIREELSAEFATKNDIQTLISQNTYTKSEIDAKISSLPTGGGGGTSCACELKTKNDVLNYLKQNTYTKEEIDAKIAGTGSDWEDGTEVPITGPSLPISVNSFNGVETSGQLVAITVKKYHNNEYVDYYGEKVYLPYKYVVSYQIDGSDNNGGEVGIIIGAPNVSARIDQIRFSEKTTCSEGKYNNTQTFYSAFDISYYFVESVGFYGKN